VITYTNFDEAQTQGVFELCRALGWPSYSEDASTTRQVLQAPGATTVVARDGELLVGISQVFGDGRIQALLALLGVLPSHRRRGIGRELLREVFSRAGGKWLDLAAEAGSESFYRAFVHQERSGFRVYPSVTFADAARAVPRRE
jgi:ribosomal protein S18 acetylase RimI-like enzyme